MSDDLRIDLALARATGLPLRSANDASTAFATASPAAALATPSTLFSPLALLLARFLPAHGEPIPTPTPDEARLLDGYLQQRVVAALQAAGITVPPNTRLAVDAVGTLHVASAGPVEPQLIAALRHDPDIARLIDVLQRAAAQAVTTDVAVLTDPLAALRAASPRLERPAPDLRRAWPWRLGGTEDGDARAAGPRVLYAVIVAALAALVLAWWLLG